MTLRRTPQTVIVVRELLETPLDWRHGYDLCRSLALKSGTLYPILIRLTQNQLLETKWEPSENGKPPRHMYRLTASGKRFALDYVAKARPIATSEPVFGV